MLRHLTYETGYVPPQFSHWCMWLLYKMHFSPLRYLSKEQILQKPNQRGLFEIKKAETRLCDEIWIIIKLVRHRVRF